MNSHKELNFNERVSKLEVGQSCRVYSYLSACFNGLICELFTFQYAREVLNTFLVIIIFPYFILP